MLATALLLFVTVSASAASTDDDGPTTVTSQLKPAAIAEAAGSRKSHVNCFFKVLICTVNGTVITDNISEFLVINYIDKNIKEHSCTHA